MKKNVLLFASALLLVSCGGAPSKSSSSSISSSSSLSSSSSQTSVDTGEREVNINKAAVADFITGEFSSFSCFAYDDHFEKRLFVFDDLKSVGESILVNTGGFIKNSTPLYSLNEITVTYSGDLSLGFGNSVALKNEHSIESGNPLTLPSGVNYFSLKAEEETTIDSISLKFLSMGEVAKREIRLYEADNHTYSSLEFTPGETVDPSLWEKPIYKHEGKTVPFKSWMNESMSEEVNSPFAMPNKSLAFYPSFTMPRLYYWSYDPELMQYKSTGYGVRDIEGLSGQFGDFKARFTVNNISTVGIGLIFNASLNNKDYPKDYTDGNEYFYFHLNPTNGGFQFAIVKDKYDAKKSIALTSAPSSWQSKWNKWNNDGRVDPLSFTMEVKAEYLTTSIIIDDDVVLAYEGQTGLKGTSMGMRTNLPGNVVDSWSFEKYEYSYSSKNGYLIDTKTGTYQTIVANATIALGNFSSRHGKFAADVTWSNKTSSNARTGIYFDHGIKSSDDAVLVNDSTNYGYFMHHNPYANANFTATMYSQGVYGKRPNGSSGNIGVTNYSSSTTGVLASYYTRNRDFFTGNAETLTVRYQIEVTASYLAISVDGTEIYRYASSALLNLFDGLPECIHPGFTSNVAGTKFSNLTFEALD